MAKKITEEELKRLQGMNAEFTKTKLALADSLLQQKELSPTMEILTTLALLSRSAYSVSMNNNILEYIQS